MQGRKHCLEFKYFADRFNYVGGCGYGTDPITRYFRSILNLKVNSQKIQKHIEPTRAKLSLRQPVSFRYIIPRAHVINDNVSTLHKSFSISLVVTEIIKCIHLNRIVLINPYHTPLDMIYII